MNEEQINFLRKCFDGREVFFLVLVNDEGRVKIFKKDLARIENEIANGTFSLEGYEILINGKLENKQMYSSQITKISKTKEVQKRKTEDKVQNKIERNKEVQNRKSPAMSTSKVLGLALAVVLIIALAFIGSKFGNNGRVNELYSQVINSSPAATKKLVWTKLYDYFESKTNKDNAKLCVVAIMANMEAESKVSGSAVEGLLHEDSEKTFSYYTADGEKTKTVNKPEEYIDFYNKGYLKDKKNNSEYYKYSFVYDEVGFGLVQFTFYSYKQALWEFCEKYCKKHKIPFNIADVNMQVEFLRASLNNDLQEVETTFGEYANSCADPCDLLHPISKQMLNSSSLEDKTCLWLEKYERPETNNNQARISFAYEIMEKYDNNQLFKDE